MGDADREANVKVTRSRLMTAIAAGNALGLGGGSRPTGVLVQRWGAVAGSGAQPREIFFYHFNGF